MTSPLRSLCFIFAACVYSHSLFAQGTSSSQSSAAGSSTGTSAAAEVSAINSSASSSETKPPEIKPSRDNELLAAALKAIAKEDEVEWIESDKDKTIALYKASETKVMKGTLWILHAPDSQPAWPPSLEILRRNLPLFGWASFALPLPHKKNTAERLSSSMSSEPSASSAATASASSSSEASSTNSTETSSAVNNESQPSSASSASMREKIIHQRIDVGYAKLQEKGQLNRVVLIDNSSAPFVATKLKGLAQAVILVNLQTQEPLTKEHLKSIFANPDLPVMDVFFDLDTAQQLEQKRNHRAEALRQKLKDYQQVTIPAEDFVNLDNAQSFWLQKVRGFMDKKAESEEVKRAARK